MPATNQHQVNKHPHTHTHTDVEMIVPRLHLLLLSRSSLGFLLSRRDVSSVLRHRSSLQISQKATDAVLRLRSSTAGDPALLRGEVVTCTGTEWVLLLEANHLKHFE